MARKEGSRKEEKASSQRTPETGMSARAEMERWLERAGRHGWLHPGLREWQPQLEEFGTLRSAVPKVDIIERDAEVIVRAELPGVAKEDLDVTVSADSVMLKAHTRHEEKEETGEYYRREMRYGDYQRTVALPNDVDGENARATFKDGVLELTLPKVARTSSKKVTVE